MPEERRAVRYKVENEKVTFPIPRYRRQETGPSLPMDDIDVAREFTVLRIGAAVLKLPQLEYPEKKPNGHYIVDPTNNVSIGFEGEGRNRVGILYGRYSTHDLPLFEAMVTVFLDRYGLLTCELVLR